ncbi:MAG: tail fiber domain-containing protein, partial [Mesorhizobium sp.]
AGGWAMSSDRRIKTAIRFIGRLLNGLPVYKFRYRWGGPEQIGLMAQDVMKVKPHAVFDVGGVLHVRYDIAMEA